MSEWKCWYLSRAIWGGLVALGAGVAGLYGYEVTPDDQKTLAEFLTASGAAIGGIAAVFGRIMATHQIGKPE